MRCIISNKIKKSVGFDGKFFQKRSPRALYCYTVKKTFIRLKNKKTVTEREK